MGDKIRGTVAILVGVFALVQGYMLYKAGRTDWHLWVEIVAGSLLIVIGIWRVRRHPDDPASELLK
jgi:hypothetical protein